MMFNFSDKILTWYYQNARILPWRISPHDRTNGVLPNPYHVWLSEMMLQQTTVATVKNYFSKFVNKWQTIQNLANATQDEIMTEWAGLGYYSRARNLHKTANIIVNTYQGIFPYNEKELIKLAGIGRYSAAAIAAISFDMPATVVDGNIERIISRIYCVQDPLPQSKNELYNLAKILTPIKNTGNYVQALMDLGATICTPKKPMCHLCPVTEYCQSYAQDNPETYPIKLLKPQKPIYKGSIFLIIDQNKNILVEKRPNNGLFGGMIIFPYINPHENKVKTNKDNSSVITIKESVDIMADKFDFKYDDYSVIGQVKHIFTHFIFYADIILVELNIIKELNLGNNLRFIQFKDLEDVALPTLMKKALKFYVT